MSDFKVKSNTPNSFLVRLCPRPHWGSLQLSPGPIAVFEGPTTKRRGEGGLWIWQLRRRGEVEGQGGIWGCGIHWLLFSTFSDDIWQCLLPTVHYARLLWQLSNQSTWKFKTVLLLWTKVDYWMQHYARERSNGLFTEFTLAPIKKQCPPPLGLT